MQHSRIGQREEERFAMMLNEVNINMYAIDYVVSRVSCEILKNAETPIAKPHKRQNAIIGRIEH